MRNYELMTITKASLSDDKVKAVSQEITDLIAAQKGTVAKVDAWGKRKLAYEIDGNKEGYYNVMQFQLEPANLSRFKDKIKLMDNLVRYLITSNVKSEKALKAASRVTSKKEETTEAES